MVNQTETKNTFYNSIQMIIWFWSLLRTNPHEKFIFNVLCLFIQIQNLQIDIPKSSSHTSILCSTRVCIVLSHFKIFICVPHEYSAHSHSLVEPTRSSPFLCVVLLWWFMDVFLEIPRGVNVLKNRTTRIYLCIVQCIFYRVWSKRV